MSGRRITTLVVTLILALALPSASPAHAQLSTCNISVSPQSVAPGSDTAFSFGLYNGNATAVAWMRVTRPTGDYVTLESASAYSWSATVASDTVTFSNSTLPSGYSQGFTVQALPRNTNGGPVNWGVQISDDPTGANPVTCSGNLSLTIQPQPSIINITNVRVTDVSSGAVTILWDTDVASTSQVSYGPTTDYGSNTPTNASLVTSHSVVLTGLEANSSYHFEVTSSTPADGGTSTSGDNTFLTAVQPVVVTVAAPSVATIPGTSIKPQPTEKIPPTVNLATDLSRPFAISPTMVGRATDNQGVARVEYSTDGGKDWLPVDHVAGSPKKLSYAFTPVLTEDGNYTVLVRATDTSGNIASTPPAILVIDRLPPQVGSSLLASGPNTIQPDQAGVITSVVGVESTINVSAIGGPTSITLVARPLFGAVQRLQSFSLTRSPDTGLWSGTIGFQVPGAYALIAKAIDGAGNQSQRQLFSVNAVASPVIRRSNGQALSGATVAIYALNQETNRWVLWEAAAYGQRNPQITGPRGTYHYVLPAGRYYLRVTAPGYHPLDTRIFDLSQAAPITTSLSLRRAGILSLWPDRATVSTSSARLITKPVGILPGQTPAPFMLNTLGGVPVRSLDLNGKPTVISVLSTWNPATSEQLPQLMQLQSNPDLNVLPVAEQERPGRVRVFLERSGLPLVVIPDPDGILTDRFAGGTVPTHYFLDRTGKVKRVVNGVLSASQIQAYLQIP